MKALFLVKHAEKAGSEFSRQKGCDADAGLMKIGAVRSTIGQPRRERVRLSGMADGIDAIPPFERTNNMKPRRIRRDGRPWGRKGSVLKTLQIRNLKVELSAVEIASRLLEQQEPPDPGRRIVSNPRD